MTAEPRNESVTARIDAAWDELLNVDDRTSPEEYPDMCLITRDELFDYMSRMAADEQRVISFLRQGGESLNGLWYAWDSEMVGYAKSFADMIACGIHRS